MKNFAVLLVFVFASALGINAQRLGKPTLTPTPLTAAQTKVLNQGIALHDSQRYAEAIAKYRSIVSECGDCIHAVYELALSLDAKGDKLEAVETAYRGTKYLSDELPLFYTLIANNLDDAGKPSDAIAVYRDGLKLLAGDSKFRNYRASLNYNLGITYVKQKKYAEAREPLKAAVEDDPGYASPHYLLAVVYNGTRYKVPAMLAAARFVALEFNTARTLTSAGIVVETLKPAAKDPKSAKTTINLALSAPKDEGDFSAYDLFLPTLFGIGSEKSDRKLSANEAFVDALATTIGMLEEDKKLKDTFVGRNYIPFVAAMKKNGHLDAFGHIVLFINDRGNSGAGKWIDANEAKIRAFLDWAKAFRPASR